MKTEITQADVPTVKEVPTGCLEIPGFIIDVFDGSAWITKDGQITDKWSERGIWPTAAEAEEMRQKITREMEP
jgi:hypothetical protein